MAGKGTQFPGQLPPLPEGYAELPPLPDGYVAISGPNPDQSHLPGPLPRGYFPVDGPGPREGVAAFAKPELASGPWDRYRNREASGTGAPHQPNPFAAEIDRRKTGWEGFKEAPPAYQPQESGPWDDFKPKRGPWDDFKKPQRGPWDDFKEAPPAQQTRETGPDTRGWGQWAWDSVMGRQDPRYQGVPTLDEALTHEERAQGKFFTSPEMRKIRTGAALAADDKAYGDIMQNALGKRFVKREADQYGYEVITYRGADGQERTAYVNRPGLDSEDIARGMLQTVPYVMGGGLTGALAKRAGLKLLGTAGAQGLTAAGTSVAQDVAAGSVGSEQGIDVPRAAITGAAGIVGEAAAVPIAAAWRKFVTVPGLYDASAGQLTPKGVQIAVEAGLDPQALVGKLGQEFAKTYARTGEAAMAGRQVASTDLGIESTIGQRTKDAQRLTEEGAMRRGLYGEGAKQELRAFDDRQAQQIRNAVLGNVEEAGAGNVPNTKGIAASLNPTRDIDRMTPQEMGQAIQEGLQTARQSARQAENQAWQGLHQITAHPEAMDLLPAAVGRALGEREIDQVTTPAAYRMANMMQRYMTGEPAEQTLSVLGQSMQAPTVDGMRRRLLNTMRNATTPEDRAAAGRLYDGFNDWIGIAADAQRLTGHPDAAAALRGARQISREIRDLFQPREGGKSTPAAGLLQRVLEKADSPEAVVQSLFGSGPNAGIKSGTVGALQRMKTALDRFGGAEGQNVWNDIRTTHWLRLVTDRKGEMASPTVMLNTLKTAFEKQGTLMSQLYAPSEIRTMRQLMKSLEQVTYKDPNPSGSGYTIGLLAREFLGTLMDAIPFAQKITVPLKAVYSISGLPDVKGRMAARAATSQALPLPSKAPSGFASGAVAGAEHERR